MGCVDISVGVVKLVSGMEEDSGIEIFLGKLDWGGFPGSDIYKL